MVKKSHRLAWFSDQPLARLGRAMGGCVKAILGAAVTVSLAIPSADGEAGTRKFEGGTTNNSPEEVPFIPAERPFDAVNIFGDLAKSLRPLDSQETKLWWERLIRGEVGKDRFLILCALKDGNWKAMSNIRDYVEFQLRETYAGDKMFEMLSRMALTPKNWHPIRNRKMVKVGEGWLEKNRDANPVGISSQWRIKSSVLPLLYFLLMSCPEENRCK